jgi:hypothetical protein
MERTVIDDRVRPWGLSWPSVLIGAMTAVVAVALFGFTGTAIGAHMAGNEGRITSWNGVGPGAVAFAVFAAFLAFVIGGWVAARIAGWSDAQNAALHGALVWVVGMFLILALSSFGAAFLSGWYTGIAPAPIAPPATPGQALDPNAAIAARNGALAAVTAMLIGLMGAVIGGWMASNEPMTFRGMPRVRIETGTERSVR